METAEYLQGITNGFGARLAINEDNTYPFPFDEGIDIAAGMETSIGLKLVRQLDSVRVYKSVVKIQ